ncbi:MAG: hypothetical protein JNL79_00695 [Myxococcales bacterium]|nr:hypothetical protein [Myxococcales bacterium]
MTTIGATWRCTAAGRGGPREIHAGYELSARRTSLLTDDEYVYFSSATTKSGEKAGIRRAKKTGGVTLLVPFEDSILRLALVGPYLYFLSTSSTLHRAPKAGGPAKRLPIQGSQIRAFVVDGDSIYWTDQGSNRVLRASLAGL